MPRSQQSKEAAIVAYFRTADLNVAQVVLKLAADEVKARVSKSVAAKARAASVPKAAPKPAPKPVPPPAKKSHKKKAAPATAPRRRAPVEPPYTEDDLNGSGTEQ